MPPSPMPPSPELLSCKRHLFDLPDEIAYLNCAYMSPLTRAAIEAGTNAVKAKAQPWHTSAKDFFTESEITRGLFAELVGADREGIAIVPSASYGISTAAANLPLSAGDEILVLAEQFPSNIYPWVRKAKATGATIHTVKRTSWKDAWTPAILDAITQKTRIIALPHCHWTDGSWIDLKQVSQKAKSIGAALVLDLAQSAGALPINMSEIEPDFAVAPTYKWLMGPYALGFLYVAPRRRDGCALEENWLNRKDSADFAGLVDYEDEYQPGARRFDMGERANFQLMPMAKSALESLLDWGVENIAATLRAKTDDIARRAIHLGLETGARDNRAPHFLGLRFPDGPPANLLDHLNAHNVFVSQRGTSIRVTPNVYNNDADIDRLFAALKTCR
ncbi:MAG: aminotransferase class V-fold PLP-dependent enzyme [Parvibaculum sp.]